MRQDIKLLIKSMGFPEYLEKSLFEAWNVCEEAAINYSWISPGSTGAAGPEANLRTYPDMPNMYPSVPAGVPGSIGSPGNLWDFPNTLDTSSNSGSGFGSKPMGDPVFNKFVPDGGVSGKDNAQFLDPNQNTFAKVPDQREKTNNYDYRKSVKELIDKAHIRLPIASQMPTGQVSGYGGRANFEPNKWASGGDTSGANFNMVG